MVERFMVTLLMPLKLSVAETDRLVVSVPSDSMVAGVAFGLVTTGASPSTVNDQLWFRTLLLLSVAFTVMFTTCVCEKVVIVWLETLYPPAMDVIMGVTVLPFTLITILAGLTPDALSVMFTLICGMLSLTWELFAGISPDA